MLAHKLVFKYTVDGADPLALENCAALVTN